MPSTDTITLVAFDGIPVIETLAPVVICALMLTGKNGRISKNQRILASREPNNIGHAAFVIKLRVTCPV